MLGSLMLPGVSNAFIVSMIVLGIWELVWKGIALWKCGRKEQLPWFVAILIVNSAGILPIIYLLFFQKKEKVSAAPKKTVAAKKPAVKKIVKKKAVKKKK